ncbi:MAG: hypothetical protein GY757_09415, partial [bacterium]|nr:hypothetical protein [bacterium]
YEKEKILIGTRSKGFYLYDGTNTEPLPTEADSFLREKQLYHGIRLFSGEYALATRQGGLVIIDSRGKIKRIFDKTHGIPDNAVKHVSQDSQGNLWLALGKGISKIEYPSPLSTYDERLNIQGFVMSVQKHQTQLFIGAWYGLFSLDSSGKGHKVAGISSSCWYLKSIDDSLLAATTHGLLQVENNTKRLVTRNSSYFLSQSRQEPKRVWVGTSIGLTAIYYENENWNEEYHYSRVKGEIRTIVEDKKGNLWLGTRAKGVIKLDFPEDGSITNPKITHYKIELTSQNQEVRVFTAAGHIMFGTEKKMFRFDKKTEKFIPDATLGPEFTDGEHNVYYIAEDKKQNIWIHSMSRNIQAIRRP